jgi:hypothetical protein
MSRNNMVLELLLVVIKFKIKLNILYSYFNVNNIRPRKSDYITLVTKLRIYIELSKELSIK